MKLTKIGPKHQVTIPKPVFDRLRLAVGDYLEVQVKGSAITMAPARVISKDQAWFYTPEWQERELEADVAIARKKVSGPFRSADALLKHLGKRKKARRP